jgi:hypothetical protein
MSKKNFKSAPKAAPTQPTAEVIDAFVDGGPGRDVQKAETQKNRNTETQKTVPQEPMARLTVDLPKSAHQRFKAACVIGGVKMNEEIRKFIDRRTKQLEDKA